MATWITHMRIAEYFMQKNEFLNNIAFLVGNIGPDCGVPNEDWTEYTPGKEITHWKGKDGVVRLGDFREQYLQNPEDPRYAFYLGYYCHLLTDIAWAAFFREKKKEPVYREVFEKEKNPWRMIKKDWYGQDHVYLKHHPDSVFFEKFAPIESFENIYFDFYPPHAFTRQIRYITDFYVNAKEDENRIFPYLSVQETENFLKNTIGWIEQREEGL